MIQGRNAQIFGIIGVVALGLALGSATAFGASGGSSGGGSGSGGSHNCKNGTHWDPNKGQCAKHSDLEDHYRYEHGRDLALAGHYEEALKLLKAVKDPGTMTFTMIGYATRKLGNYDEGVAYYAKALALDSNNVDTH